MAEPPSSDRWQPGEVKRLLARIPLIEDACHLDLLLFLYRHPRALLTSAQLADFVGYNLKDIAKALDAFIEAGLLERTAQQSTHAARMFLLLLDAPNEDDVRAILELASTRSGRRSILQSLTRDRRSVPAGLRNLSLSKALNSKRGSL
jgi:DNA-binding MarR family transcriptional regulator